MKRRNNFPEFDNLKEMVNFWDDHDFPDFEDEFEEAPDIKFDIKNRHYLPISSAMYEKMESIALEKGISVEILMRTWVEEKLVDFYE